MSAKPQTTRKFVSARKLGLELGMSVNAVLRLYRDGIIDAEVHEGTLIRFDAEKVKATLAKRAKRNRGEVAAPTNQPGMVPTY